MRSTRSFFVFNSLLALAGACSRAFYESGTGDCYTGRSMDWFESMKTKLWIFPRGMARDGGVGEGSLQWTSKYGSVVASSYDIATTDGINEAGLVGNVLYLAEAQYGTAKRQGQKKISMGAMLQHILDNFGTVREAVDFNRGDNLCVIAPDLPNGEKTTVHVSISDAKNDSAVFEYIDGQLRIHHGSEYRVMTNSPPYDRQVALANYWTEIGGYTFLPGTHRAADRFARLSYNLHAVPKVNQSRQAVATVFSLMRHISVPLGITAPQKPNLASTLWRSVADHTRLVYYFESVTAPSVFWVDLKQLDFSPSQPLRSLEVEGEHVPWHSGEVSKSFQHEEKPFEFLKPSSATKSGEL